MNGPCPKCLASVCESVEKCRKIRRLKARVLLKSFITDKIDFKSLKEHENFKILSRTEKAVVKYLWKFHRSVSSKGKM